MSHRRPAAALPAIVTGLAAGAIASLAMDEFLKLVTSGQRAIEKQKKLAEGESQWTVAHEQALEEQQEAEHEDSTQKVARKLAESTGLHLSPDEKKTVGQAVHYSFGSLAGALYAVTAELLPEVTIGSGAAFGTALFLTADEIAVPAFRLGPAFNQIPLTSHLEYWAAHVVYGVTLDLSRSLLRRLF